jgi:hypothetical protein
MSVPERQLSAVDQEIVNSLLDTQAINFEALGKTIAAVGPAPALMTNDGWIRFCGNDVHIFRWPRASLGLEELEVLRNIVRDVQRRG